MSKLGYRVRVAVDAATLGPRRRRRAMTRALQRLDHDDVVALVRPRRRRLRIPTSAVALVVAIGVAIALIWWSSASFPHHSALPGATRNVGARSAGAIAGAPTTTHLSSKDRMLPAPTLSPSSHTYRFLYHDGTKVVTWEPCRPIHYVVNRGDEPPAFDAMLQQAVAEVSRDTGLKFVSDGPTGEQLLENPTSRAIYQPRRYGDRWAPVLISWSNSAASAELAGTEAGFAGPVEWAPSGQPLRLVSGVVAYDLTDLQTIRARPHGATGVYEVLLHELGHLVGLDHVTDKNQVMYPTLTHPIGHYAPGDVAGLAVLGNGSCFTDY